ncbi:MAG: hypothetical protein IT241_03695 [Bacteroidia bacterium]|nr:hypothetical protein [Bacteroidia bacterium]
MPKYTQQIVVFLDILGFSAMLEEFESEALENNEASDNNYHESLRLNKLIDIFQGAIQLIRKSDCNYYLFSDNICITIDYIQNETEKPDLFIEILILISLLMNEFVKEGYFLRGGVDAGWFLDSRDVAVGMPLVNAYCLESKVAVHPRIVISDNFKNLAYQYIAANKINEYLAPLADKYLTEHEQVGYLNPFFYITSYEEKGSKIQYLETYSSTIKSKIEKHGTDEKILAKYKWFSNEFNRFIDLYATVGGYKEIDSEDIEFSPEELEKLISFKINTDGI